MIERFLSSTGAPLNSYRAIRTLEAATRGGKMRARLRAQTVLDAAGGFQYAILEEDGSGTIRQRVLRPALEAEREMRSSGDVERGALTASNYDFADAQSLENGRVEIGIHPKRQDKLLLQGKMLLMETDGDLVRVEGSLIKRPSIWTRHVEVVREYARIGGVRVPVSMQSTARVLIVGKSTFSMTYEYQAINGLAVEPSDTPGHASLPLSN
jgi:hypothetical protein